MRGMFMAVLVVLAASGCGPMEEHSFSRAPDSADVSAPAESQRFTYDMASSAAPGTVGAADFCSGSCNSSTCSCTGSYECCSAGCRACWDVLEQQRQL